MTAIRLIFRINAKNDNFLQKNDMSVFPVLATIVA